MDSTGCDCLTRIEILFNQSLLVRQEIFFLRCLFVCFFFFFESTIEFSKIIVIEAIIVCGHFEWSDRPNTKGLWSIQIKIFLFLLHFFFSSTEINSLVCIRINQQNRFKIKTLTKWFRRLWKHQNNNQNKSNFS